MTDQRPTTTTDAGIPAPSDHDSLSVGPNGPLLLQDHYLIQKMAQFNRERVPERIVHAKGSGAFGYFEVTADVTPWTKAAFLNSVGKRTPVLLRFSTVAGELGSADTVRDPRGFALKFYTEEGNYDLVGNNTQSSLYAILSSSRTLSIHRSACLIQICAAITPCGTSGLSRQK